MTTVFRIGIVSLKSMYYTSALVGIQHTISQRHNIEEGVTRPRRITPSSISIILQMIFSLTQ